MLSNKPYLIRAFYDWIVDSRCTPVLVVNAHYPRCVIPEQQVENGEITFNLSPEAIRDLKIHYDKIEFRASFSGEIQNIFIPMKAVLAIYADDNKEGMYFDYEEENFFENELSEGEAPAQLGSDEKKKKPKLRIVEVE